MLDDSLRSEFNSEMNSITSAGKPCELPDYLAYGLKVIFVGFNPSIYSAAAGHYYARPANQFWRCLNNSGLLPRGANLGPPDDSSLTLYGLGLTDVVKRPTRSCSDLTASDYKRGVAELCAKLKRYAPGTVAFNGKGVFEAFRRYHNPRRQAAEEIKLGLQRPDSAGPQNFVLPSTSSINARLSLEEKLAHFRALANSVGPYV